MSDNAHDNHDADDHGKGHKSHAPHGAHPEHEHEEGWIVGFADNVLLQMGFFVILLAMNIGPKGGGEGGDGPSGGKPNNNMLDFAIAVREAFHSPVDLSSSDPNDAALIERLRQRESQGETLDPGPDGTHKGAQTVRPGNFRDIAGFVEFEDRSSGLSVRGTEAARELAQQLKGTRWIIEVRGHTSTLETFRDTDMARKLSFERAYAVGKALVAKGMDWRQLRISAVGDADPVTPRAGSASEHAGNQRVEIIKTPETMPPDPYAGQPGGER